MFVSQKIFDYTTYMIGSKKQTVEDIIVETLARDPYITGPVLVEKVNDKRPGTTKQAVYAALSPLLKDEVIYKRGQEYFLTNTWVRYVNQLLNPELVTTDEVFVLEEGQSISYRFPSLLSCDKYWAHIFTALIKTSYSPRGVFIWHPHYIFILGREKVEKEIIEDQEKYQNPGYYSFGGTTDLDRAIKKEYTSDYLRINIGEDIGFKKNYMLNIFGDIIIEVFLAKELAQKIDDWYHVVSKPTKQDLARFETFFEDAHLIRMKISRNTKKASKLRKKLSKNFYVPSNET